MKASLLYRIAAVLLLLFALGHTLGFRQSDPAWGVDALLSAMRAAHFEVQGFTRTYWDLFTAAGFSVGVFFAHRILGPDYTGLDMGRLESPWLNLAIAGS